MEVVLSCVGKVPNYKIMTLIYFCTLVKKKSDAGRSFEPIIIIIIMKFLGLIQVYSKRNSIFFFLNSHNRMPDRA